MSNKPHLINVNDLQEWLGKTEVQYASDMPLKKLTVTTSGGFKLYHNGVVVWEGIQPYRAVEKYNEL